MAAYRRVYDSRHLLADCQEPESAPEPYARQSSMGYLLEGTRRATILSVLCKCKRVMCVSDDRRLNSFVESTATRRIRTWFVTTAPSGTNRGLYCRTFPSTVASISTVLLLAQILNSKLRTVVWPFTFNGLHRTCCFWLCFGFSGFFSYENEL